MQITIQIYIIILKATNSQMIISRVIKMKRSKIIYKRKDWCWESCYIAFRYAKGKKFPIPTTSI